MRAFTLPALAAVLLLGACSKAEESASAPQDTEAAMAEPAAGAGAPAASPDALKVGDGTAIATETATPRPPQIAYVYEYGFRLAGDRIAPLQRRHADLCESKGPQVCRIISMSQSGSEGDYVTGSLQLAVAAKQARAFGDELTRLAEGADGEQVSAGIAGEDLSKQIVDTEARLRARTLLRDRLMEVLASRKGTVAELVEAERGVAQVNEEIDQAQSWLAEMRGRVDFSRINVGYESGSPSSGGFVAPIRDALGSVGSVLGSVIGGLITLVAGLLPIAALIALLVWANRKLGWLRRKKPDEKIE